MMFLETFSSGSSSDCPGVYVPVHPFKTWWCHFDGGLDSIFPWWDSGYVAEGSPSQAKPESTFGPANTSIVYGPLTIP